MNAAGRALRVSSASWRILRWTFAYGIFVIFLAILIINAIVVSVQEGSIVPIITELGGNVVLVTSGINEQSLVLLEESESLGTFDKVKFGFFLLGEIFVLLAWIKILMWVFANTLLHGDTSRKFTNFILAIGLFFLLQYMFILFVHAVAETDISQYTGGIVDVGNGAVNNLKVPHQALINMSKAVYVLLIQPVLDFIQNLGIYD